ncbi:hypothetical protein G6F57_013616 [Rhizopus arrhizus]|nr:hypothetical protein G6F57_013616 [Rhizopus arrhizus]
MAINRACAGAGCHRRRRAPVPAGSPAAVPRRCRRGRRRTRRTPAAGPAWGHPARSDDRDSAAGYAAPPPAAADRTAAARWSSRPGRCRSPRAERSTPAAPAGAGRAPGAARHRCPRRVPPPRRATGSLRSDRPGDPHRTPCRSCARVQVRHRPRRVAMPNAVP